MTSTLTLASLAPAIPEIYLTVALCVILLVDAFAGQASRRLTPTLTLAALVIGAALTARYADVSSSVTLFSGMYVADPLGNMLKLFAFLFIAVGLLYSRHYLDARGLLKGEYYVLTLSALLGICVMISAGSLLSMYMGIELLSLSLYALVAFNRDSGIAAESAIKYFVLGAIASGCLLYGMSLVYGMSGSLLFSDIADSLRGVPSLGLIMGLVFLVVGVAFKFGAVPFHMWVPDVYHGAPSSVTLLIASAPKIGSFALAYRLLVEALGGVATSWMQMLAIIAVLSLFLGNVVAVAQTNMKRLLAYSAIGNVGFILLGFVAGSEQGVEAALFYTLAYIITTLGAFGVVLLASPAGFEADHFDHYKGLHARDPMLALAMMVMMFSVGGMPLFVGFWAKLQIFQALWAVNATELVVIAALISVIGLYYCLRVIKLMYFDAPGDFPRSTCSTAERGVLLVNAAIVVALGLLPNTLLSLCEAVIG